MFRAVLYLIATILVISVVRAIINVILKGFADLFQTGKPSPSGPRRPTVSAGGELKKDPVCGTFISTESALQKRVGGETYYFCSAECRDNFKS
ncbi:MAG TPA: YHS domain-containing protein [Bryobacteraceae bacterium]|nr:YHS domain-containing protein [Bryobacteraceae bacterium]